MVSIMLTGQTLSTTIIITSTIITITIIITNIITITIIIATIITITIHIPGRASGLYHARLELIFSPLPQVHTALR
jgi:hypothetical protein